MGGGVDYAGASLTKRFAELVLATDQATGGELHLIAHGFLHGRGNATPWVS